jgi:hypothetical protein
LELRIGIAQAPRELEVDLPDDTDRTALLAEIDSLLAKGDGVLWCTDRRGKRVGIAVPRIAWVEVGMASSERRVGFGTS